MRAFLMSLIAMAAISAGAYFALHTEEVAFSSAQQYSTDAVRLD